MAAPGQQEGEEQAGGAAAHDAHVGRSGHITSPFIHGRLLFRVLHLTASGPHGTGPGNAIGGEGPVSRLVEHERNAIGAAALCPDHPADEQTVVADSVFGVEPAVDDRHRIGHHRRTTGSRPRVEMLGKPPAVRPVGRRQ
ncbi:hypothetical protein GCM10009800_28040 [Nocardiopsis rhodophaea]